MPPADRRSPRPVRKPGPWSHGPIPVIGLVGGIGAGKSAVAERLAALGAFVIDADHVGHALLDQRPVRERLVARFGERVLAPAENPDDPPVVDRRVLGGIVFKDPVARRALESIVHPLMRRTFEKAINRTIRRGQAKAVVLDAAILFEAGWNRLCDRVLFVDAPRDERLQRLISSRGWDEAALAAREAAQMPLPLKKAQCDVVVANQGDLAALAREVERAWKAVLGSKPPRSRPTPPRAAPSSDSPRASASQSASPRGRQTRGRRDPAL